MFPKEMSFDLIVRFALPWGAPKLSTTSAGVSDSGVLISDASFILQVPFSRWYLRPFGLRYDYVSFMSKSNNSETEKHHLPCYIEAP